MFSESLTPPPSTSSPFRPVSAGPSTLPDRPSTCVSHRLSELVKNGESSTSSSKRQIETTSLPTSPHRKRARGGTSTTLVNTSTHLKPNQDESVREGSLEIEYSRATSATTRKTHRQDTSEGGEHEDSVLFSEQIQPSRSTVVKGNMEDYIPQAEPLATMIPTEGTEGLENIEQLDDAEDVEEEGRGEEAEEGPPEEGDELDESHDRNDEEDDGGDEAAETPPWLLEPHIITREPVDKMSMVIEGKNGTAKRSTRRHIEEAVIVNEEFQEEADGPQSYHSGDTDDYEMHHRPVLERTAVKRDIRKMTESMATLVDHDTQELLFKVVDRLGEGESKHGSLYRIVDHARNVLIGVPGPRSLLPLLRQLSLDRMARRVHDGRNSRSQEYRACGAEEDLGHEQSSKDRKRAAYSGESKVSQSS